MPIPRGVRFGVQIMQILTSPKAGAVFDLKVSSAVHARSDRDVLLKPTELRGCEEAY